jgi:HK97 gp10 family phage protein
MAGEKINFRIDALGVPELQKKLAEMPTKMQKKTLRKAMKSAGQVVLGETISRAPVNTGQLVASLALKAMARKFKVGVRIQTDEGWYQGDSFYGAFVELGTSKMSAKPFMRPALSDSKTQCLQIVRNELERLINESRK